MATTSKCDRCGGEAVCAVEVSSTVTTKVRVDLCEECLKEFKLFTQWLTGQYDDTAG